MADVLKITGVSSSLDSSGNVVLCAVSFCMVDEDSGAVKDYVFPQTEGSGSLTANMVGMYPFGGMVFQVTSDTSSDDIVVVAIPADEYPDGTNAVEFTLSKATWLAAEIGGTVEPDSEGGLG